MATYDRKTKVHPWIIIMQMLISRLLPYVLIFIFSSAEIFSYKVKLEFIFTLYFFFKIEEVLYNTNVIRNGS